MHGISERSRRNHEMIRNHLIGTVPRNGKGSIIYTMGRIVLDNIKNSENSRSRETN